VTDAGRYALGPGEARLLVRTGRTGAIAKAGHDLLLEVQQWSATLTIGENASLELTADSRSMRVLEGTGGLQALDRDDKANIVQTIDDEVLKGATIAFQSSSVSGTDGRLTVDGELKLGDRRAPVSFTLAIGDDGRLSGEATVKQTDFGMKPYSALFGTLKVADEVRIEIDGQLPKE
jgi:polyisoprenoid-binding protein YceI